MSSSLPSLRVPFGAWHRDEPLELTFPAGAEVHLLAPDDAPEIDEAQIDAALAAPYDAPLLAEIAVKKRRAVVVVDDLTRPTPTHRFLARVLETLQRSGLSARDITILFGAAAHRPMLRDEMALKIGKEVLDRHPIVMHDFTGPDIREVGWIDGGPVYLNRQFLDADLRIVIGGVIPHGETGFGGGAKMIVPGIAGRHTITHFHGALPPRTAGNLEADVGTRDRRTWCEAVARRVGVDWAICATVNSRRQLAGLYCGDVVTAHRAAAAQARRIGRTPLSRALASRAAVAVVNAYPLDTDPIQMGKSVSLVKALGAPRTVVINAASDGVFYHGMGMGSGVQVPRLLRNIPRLIFSAESLRVFFGSLRQALGSLQLMARTCYFSLNQLSHARFLALTPRLASAGGHMASAEVANPLAFSQRFPAWGFARRYPQGRLFSDWEALRGVLAQTYSGGAILVFPCAPLQWLDLEPA